MKVVIRKKTRLFFEADHDTEMKTLLPGTRMKMIAKIPGYVVLEVEGHMPVSVREGNVVIDYGEEREAI